MHVLKRLCDGHRAVAPLDPFEALVRSGEIDSYTSDSLINADEEYPMARAAILEADVSSQAPSFEPVESLRGEQTQLESWVHQSFAALERLHNELNEWQQELTKQQSELDQNQSDWTDSESERGKYQDQIDELQEQLEQAHQEVRQLEEELAVQAQEYAELEHRCMEAQERLKSVRKYSEQLSCTLESERQQDGSQRQQGNEWLHELGDLMERQDGPWETKSQDVAVSDLGQPLEVISEAVPPSIQKSANAKKESCDEIRQLAKNRRAANRRKRAK
jgi:chromosome segregation ATPase